jgi:hypothetical protein
MIILSRKRSIQKEITPTFLLAFSTDLSKLTTVFINGSIQLAYLYGTLSKV